MEINSLEMWGCVIGKTLDTYNYYLRETIDVYLKSLFCLYNTFEKIYFLNINNSSYVVF